MEGLAFVYLFSPHRINAALVDRSLRSVDPIYP